MIKILDYIIYISLSVVVLCWLGLMFIDSKQEKDNKYYRVVVNLNSKQTDEYYNSLELNLADGTEWGGWLSTHVKECSQCKESFLKNPNVGICDKAFGKMMEIFKKSKISP